MTDQERNWIECYRRIMAAYISSTENLYYVLEDCRVMHGDPNAEKPESVIDFPAAETK